MLTSPHGLRPAALVPLCLAVAFAANRSALAQIQPGDSSSITYKVTAASERLEMIVNTSRILTLDKVIPKWSVNDRDKITVTPLSAKELQISATKTGVTQINMWTEGGGVHTIDVIIYGDARELGLLLQQEFPQSALKVRPLANSVVISGYVDRPDYVSRIIKMAEDYYPKVINNITVGGVQQVQLHVKVMEVSRTKIRQMGFDFAAFSGNDFIISSVSGLISATGASSGTVTSLGGDTVSFGLVDGNTSFFGFLDLLRQYDLMKVLAEPTLVTVSGRPAYFEVGGEIPIPIPQSLGTITIEYKRFGTRLDFVPVVLGNGNIRLEVRPEVSELDASQGVVLATTTIPAVRRRIADTGVEMKAGQTLALAGLLQQRTEAQNVGIPWLADLPWFGAAFRRVREETNEIELLVLVTPELVDAMDCHEVPPCGPGMHSVSPNDVDLYWRGHLEVPRCDGVCGPPVGGHGGYGGHEAVPGGIGVAPNGSEEAPLPKGPAAPPANGTGTPPSPGAQRGYIKNPVVRTQEAAPLPPARAAHVQSGKGAGQTWSSDPSRFDYLRQRTAANPIPPSDPQSPYNRTPDEQTADAPGPSPSRAASSGGPPGMIGPVGYDVLD